MISNKIITFSAACLVYANGLDIKLDAQLESQDIFSDFADWTVGAANDVYDWSAGAVNDAYDWSAGAVSDVGDAFVDAADWAWGAGTDAYDWMSDGDNWAAMGKTMLGATVTGFSGDWEAGWDLFTNPDMYLGETYDRMDAAKKQQEAYEKMVQDQAAFCATNEPKVGEPMPGTRYTITSEFNYQMTMNRIDFTVIYGAFGVREDPDWVMVDPRECDEVDCLNPCYGEDQLGACSKCADHLMKYEGERSSVCDLCVV